MLESIQPKQLDENSVLAIGNQNINRNKDYISDLPSDLSQKILDNISTFGSLTILSVSKKFNELLDHDDFWKAKLANIMKFDPESPYSMRSQFILAAITELNVINDLDKYNGTFDLTECFKKVNYTPLFFNQLEMVLEICHQFKPAYLLNTFFRYIKGNKELWNNEEFALKTLSYIDTYEYISKNLLENKDFIFKASDLCGDPCPFLSTAVLKDKLFVLNYILKVSERKSRTLINRLHVLSNTDIEDARFIDLWSLMYLSKETKFEDVQRNRHVYNLTKLNNFQKQSFIKQIKQSIEKECKVDQK